MAKPLRKKKKESVKEKDTSLLSSVEQELEQEGILPFDDSDIMEDYLRLPADITEETSKELGRFFSTFTKQKMYCRTLLGRACAIYREFNEELNDLREELFKSLPVKMSIKEKELQLRSYGDAKLLIDRVAFAEEKKRYLEIYLQNLEDGIFAISREISRRESDWDNQNREDNMGRGNRR